MSLLFRILRAAHATGTHHKLALDALPRLAGPLADGWSRAMLVAGARLIEGSKAPDDTFKDFANHVLHPRDDYWGGAPEKVVEWYGRVTAALRAGDATEAAYAAGVLSHYLSDPFMPLHTGQSEAENTYHRAVEWSINRSYDRLMVEWEASGAAAAAVEIGPGAGGLKDLVCRGAERSNAYYEALLAHYDLSAGVVDPPSGLDAQARLMAAEMLVAARDAFAAVLSRAIGEAGVAAPQVSLTGPTLTAVMAIPRKLLEKRLADAGDRAIVLAQYDELRATGHVEATLDEDQRTVRDAYAAEVLPRRTAARETARARRVGVTISQESLLERLDRRTGQEQFAMPDQLSRLSPRPTPTTSPDKAAIVLPRRDPATPRSTVADGPANELAAQSTAVPTLAVTEAPRDDAVGVVTGPVATALAAAVVASSIAELAPARPPKPPRIHLATSDAIEAAPSIGPKTAERLAGAGLHTVADLLSADPELIAQSGVARVDAGMLRDWQDQARLVLTIPGLRGGGAQLLVGAGYRSLDVIAAAEPDKLCADVLAFAATSAGNRILRDGQPPDIEKIKAWADAAREAANAA